LQQAPEQQSPFALQVPPTSVQQVPFGQICPLAQQTLLQHVLEQQSPSCLHEAPAPAQLHLPAWQVAPLGHTFPHVPQSLTSVCRSTQPLGQQSGVLPEQQPAVEPAGQQVEPLSQHAPTDPVGQHT